MKMLEWRLHAKSYEHKQLVSEAKDIAKRAAQKADFIVSWSTGKDSTALTHLVKSVCPDLPILIQFDDCDWPEKRLYFEKICKSTGWNPHVVEPSFSIWDSACKANIGVDNLCAQSHDLTKYGFIKLLDDKRKKLGCDGVFLGLRMLEGKARKINLASRGPIYQLKDKSWRCNPLWRWGAKDVFAYLVDNGVEINPCYLNNKFLQPEEIRLSWALPTAAGMSRVDMAHIRYYYPDHYRRLRSVGVTTVS